MGHQLHCNLCGSTFGTRKNVWEEHIRTAKHLRLLRSKTAGDRRVTQTSLEQFAGTDAAAARQRGKIEMEHRVRVVRAVTSSNMALSAIDGDMKELLEEKRDFRLAVGDASNLARQTLPRITADLDTEDKVAVEAGGGFFSFFFDGFSDGDEHSLVVFRTCTERFHLFERVSSLRLWEGSLTGQQWTRIVDRDRRRLGSDGLVFSVGDGHPGNGIVGEAFLHLLEHYIHMFCTPHTLSLTGSKTNAPLVDTFSSLWHNVFKNSPSTRALVSGMMGEEVKRKAKVRWFSCLEMLEQAMRWYSRLSEIANAIDNKGYSVEAVAKLKAFLTTNATAPTTDFALQLAAFVDINKPLRDSCYVLEGSGFLAPFWYAHIGVLKGITTKVQSIETSMSVMPNVAALCRINASVPTFNQHTAWAKVRAVVDPVCNYFLSHFIRFEHDTKTRPFRKAMQIFSFARFFHPVFAKKWIDSGHLDLAAELEVEVVKRLLGALGPNIFQELKSNFAKYVHIIETKTTVGKKYRPDDLLHWWQENGSECGSWAAAARLFTLIQPSSASAERGFAMLRAAIGPQQQKSLEDLEAVRLRQRFSIKDVSAGVE